MTSREFEIGIFLPVGGEGMMGGETATYAGLREMARSAERLGYDFVGVLDHLLFHHWECWTMLGALAEATETMKLISYVTCTGYRNPALLARMVDTMDEISNGRLILGVGAGDSDTEHENFGYETDKLVSRFEEAMQVIGPLVRDGEIDSFKGEYYDVHDIRFQPRGPSDGDVPILVGSLGGPRMMRLTARYADIWTCALLATNGTVAGFEAALGRMNEICHEEGRDPSTLRKMAEAVVRSPGGEPSSWWDGYTVEGSTESIAEELRAFADAGADYLMLWIEPNSVSGIESLAEAVQLAKGD
ncbi:MAG: LLM class flavin-dependent oxidoreductase [Thermomicrobiales bacterium]